jgi:DNA-binding response OmpR family regulator
VTQNLKAEVAHLAEGLVRDLTALVYASVKDLLLSSLDGGTGARNAGARERRPRTNGATRAAATEVRPLRARGLIIDPESQMVQIGTRKARLTRSELSVFSYLAEHRGQWVPSDQLRAEVLGEAPSRTDSPLLRVHIRNIRKKLGPAADKLVSKRNVGFMLKA